MNESNWHARTLSFSIALFGAVISGCGGDGITRHEVSGTVMFQGKEVKDGVIVFEPDLSVGKTAPTCFVTIANGQYKTAPAESPTTGKYKLRVNGYDKSKMRTDAAPGEIIEMPELFPPFEMTLQVPPPDGRFDITVPEKGEKPIEGEKKSE